MLSVVIPTTNRPDSLIRLVESLQLQNMASSSYEVLVVYNNELQKKSSPLKDSPLVKLFCAPHPGVNHARNHGAFHARGSVILFLDDDCDVPDPSFLQKHITYHQSFPQMVAVGGPYLLTQNASLCDQIYHVNNANWIHANLTATSRSTALLGGNASYKSFIFANGSRFTEEISYGGSETPLNTILALKYGSHGYFLDLAVVHNTHLNLHSLLRKAYLQGIGAAIQTKMYGHQLKHVSASSPNSPFFLRAGLELYALFFNVGYRSHFSQKNVLIVFLTACFSRLHDVADLLGIWHLVGFLKTLAEPIPFLPQTNFVKRLAYRSLFIARKFAWLFMKTAGLR